MITFDVRGESAPKGSSRAMILGGRAVNVPSGSNVNRAKRRSWEGAIADAATEAMVGRELFAGPIFVVLAFRFSRPAGHYGSGRNAARVKDSAPRWHVVKPDIDKIARSTLDALTGITFRDDSQVAKLELSKVYTEGPPGATITIALAPTVMLAMPEVVDRMIATALPRPHPRIDPDPDDFGGAP